MSEEQAPKSERTLSGNFELTLILSDKRQCRMTGYVYSDDTKDQINARIDLYQDVMDRQFIRADLVNKEAQVQSIIVGLDQMAEHMRALAEKKDNGKPLSTVEKDKAKQFDVTVKQMVRQRESLQAAIAEGRRQLNGSAA